MAKVVVTLKDLENGNIDTYEEDYKYDEEGCEFMWSEGNFACDCNRHAFMYGNEEEYPCNVGANRFVVLEVLYDGKKLEGHYNNG